MDLLPELQAQNVAVSAEGNRIILNFPDLQAALRLLEPWWSPAKRAEFTERMHRTLASIGLVLEVRVKGKTLEIFGPNAQRGILSRILTAPGPSI